ncbi:MAG: hypothetical protein J1E37_08430 [Prevotella sp.]|nr:hypothetical protein [Prevotella sp.]
MTEKIEKLWKSQNEKQRFAWAAREKDGKLFLYPTKPVRAQTTFFVHDIECDIMQIDKNAFPKITWENSPVLVKLLPMI